MIRSSSRFLTALGGLIALSLTLTGPAFAQKDGAPAERYGRASSGDIVERTLPGTDFKLQEFTPWLVHKPKGPGEVKGVVYFIGGATRGAPLTSAKATPYLLKTMSESGWDIIGAKLPRAEFEGKPVKLSSLVPQEAAFVNGQAKELKAQGYKKVVLAGHSWGAWVAMVAAQDPQCAAGALLLSAPNTFGPRLSQTTGRPNQDFRRGRNRQIPEKTVRLNESFQKALAEFGPALSGVKTPTVLILPDDTEWDPDPGARGEIAERHFTESHVPHLIITKPSGFSGHLAGWLPIFDYRYGACIEAFLENPASGACRPVPITSKDFRSIIDIRQVPGADKRSLLSAEGLTGKNFVAYTMLDVVSKYYRYIASGRRMTMTGAEETPEDFTFKDGMHCVGGECTKLVRWSDGYLLGFDPKTGNLNAWWIEDK